MPAAVRQRVGAGDVRLQHVDLSSKLCRPLEPLLSHALRRLPVRSLPPCLSQAVHDPLPPAAGQLFVVGRTDTETQLLVSWDHEERLEVHQRTSTVTPSLPDAPTFIVKCCQ